MAVTYEPIATNTLGSATSSITFSSIPSTYTDLVLIYTGVSDSDGLPIFVRVNSDTGANYSYIYLAGNGGSAFSSGQPNRTFMRGYGTNGSSSTYPTFVNCSFLNYTSSVNKAVLISCFDDTNGSGTYTVSSNLWRNSSVINSITILSNGGTFNTGFTATLYGIKAA